VQKKLRKAVEYAVENEHCGFYRELYGSNGMNAAKIESISDFKKLPLVSKKDILRYGKEFRFVDVKELVTLEHTSGTTADIFIGFWSKQDISVFLKKARTNPYFKNQLKGRRLMVLLPPHQVESHSLNVYNTKGCHTLLGYFHDLEFTAELAKKMQIDALRTYGSCALEFAKQLAKKNYDPANIKVLISQGEMLSKRIEGLRSTFPSATIIYIYGTREFGTIGYQCEHLFGQNLYHTYPQHHLYEVLDPNTGKDCKEGEPGELALTNLRTGSGTAFVRYKTGDMVKLHANNCPCGAKGPFISPQGRTDERVRGDLRNTISKITYLTLFPSDIEKALQNLNTKDWQMHVFPDGGQYIRVLLKVVPNEGTPSFTAEDAAKIFMNQIKLDDKMWLEHAENGAVSPLEVELVEEIEKKGDKTPKVVDHTEESK